MNFLSYGRIILLHMINEEIENQEVIVNTDCFEIEDFDEDIEDYMPEIDHLFED